MREPDSTDIGERSISRRGRLRLLIVLLLSLTALRLPALLHPHPIDDERIYSVVATEMIYGGLPYEAAIERKPPLLFWAYAGVFKVVGPYNWLGLHVAAILWTLAIVAAVFWIGRILFHDRAAFAAAFLIVLFHSWGFWKNLAFNGEILMNLPIMIGVALALRRSEAVLRWDRVGAGALLCLAFLLKQPAAIAAIPVGIYLLLPGYRHRRRLRPLHSVLHGFLLAAGFFGTLAAIALWLSHLGILEEAYYWTVADHDIPHGPSDPVFWTRGVGNAAWFICSCAPLVLPAAVSIRDGLRKPSAFWSENRAEWIMLVLLLAASVVGVSASGRFYPHYFIQLVPPLAILAAPVGARFVPPLPTCLRHARILFAWLSATAIVFLAGQWVGLPAAPGDLEAIEYLRDHAAEEDRLFIWGHAPGVYVEAGVRPASRYVLTFPLTGYIFGSPLSRDPDHDTSDRILSGAWDSLKADFDRHPPDYIYDDESTRSPAKYPVDDFPYLSALLEREYELVLDSADGLLYRRRAQ
jgi:4-amino-4-deoxy-L-arabinose transferase-like glycosyltransferase